MKQAAIILLLLLSVFLPKGLNAQTMQDTTLKAAYLINFLKFVDWDEDPGKVLAIGIIDAPDITERIRAIADLNDRKGLEPQIVVQDIESDTKLSRFDLIFAPDPASLEMMRFREGGGILRALVVSDGPNSLEKGGMIEFVRYDNRLGFRVSQTNAAKSGIRLSSKLLDLAIEIK